MRVCASVIHTHLCNKLDDLDKNIKRHVSGYNATTPFREQGGGDGRQTTSGRRRDKREKTQAEGEEKVLTSLFVVIITRYQNLVNNGILKLKSSQV